MGRQLLLDELWKSEDGLRHNALSRRRSGLPDAARRYLEHAIAPDAALASAVRLRMHGEIRLRGWLPFTAEEIIDASRGFVWTANVRTRCGSIRGSDRFIDGQGAMRWKFLGILPIVSASGPDVSRSALGRWQGEAVWLPSMLCREEIRWSETDHGVAARVTMLGRTATLDLTLDSSGGLKAVKLARWGNPGGGDYRLADFGVLVDAERTFAGYTIPSQIRAGWYFGTERFEREGEFFRATIDQADFRAPHSL